MILENKNMLNEDFPQDETSPIVPLLKALVYKLKNIPKHADEITFECSEIKKYLSSSTTRIDTVEVKEIISFLNLVSVEIKAKLFLFFEDIIPLLTDPWKIIEDLLSIKDEKTKINSLNLIINLAVRKNLNINLQTIDFLVIELQSEDSILNSQEALKKISSIARLIENKSHKSDENLLLDIYLSNKERKYRIFAAKLLDLNNAYADEKTIENFFGDKAAKILSPYLMYTCATYQDLLYLIPVIGKPPPILDALLDCEKICEEHLIREVISKLGWRHLNYDLSVKHYVGITIKESLPLFVSDCEAKLFEASINAKRISEFYIFTAHGGLPYETDKSNDNTQPVTLFRSYNLAHANLLQELLDVAPLSVVKVKHILEQMDRIVSDFVNLFNSYSEECAILPDVYEQIKYRVVNEISKENADANVHLSAEVTRLVQMFEDPHSLAEVHTLHGLKRYLHQRGLQLGFKLVDQSKSPNQSINLILATKNKVLSVVRNINFANFEAREEEFSFIQIPYPIKVVIDAFGRQLLHGQKSFPSVNIFCYGNEVHYFVWFRNHPVFIRIDYSPPLQGGMIDLQYFGVSNYEIADHPNINLDAIRFLFQYLEFDIKLEGTHIQARYDKERALDLSQLCGRVEYLFCVVPYLMDLDWIIGSLNLPSDAKKKVIAAWAQLFKHWGVFPFDKIITKDRLGILQDVLVSPDGEFELVWSGEGDYQDTFTIKNELNFFDRIFNFVNKLGLTVPKFSEENVFLPGQIYWETYFLNYLHEAMNEGEIIETPEGLVQTPEEIFQKVHEADYFAEIISAGGEKLESAISLAKLLIPLEQTLKFKTTGTLESFKVQSTSLPLVGDSLRLYVLRDNEGIIRLSFFVKGNSICKKRNNVKEPWKINASLSSLELKSLLRVNNYKVVGSEFNVESLKEEVQKFYNKLQLPHKHVKEIRTSGEKTVIGLRASPGRATGRVILGSTGRLPEEFNEHIFVAASISPDENTILYHSAGIVATGGGILSHAGLIATQFNKPAIIIAGKWKQKTNDSFVLLYLTTEYQVEYKKVNNFNISLHYDLQEKEYQINDGDLVVLDANEGMLQVLGQEQNTIALFEGLKSLGKNNEDISKTSDVKELLILRGKKLHIRSQIEKILRKISKPILARYSIQEILIGNSLDGNKGTPEEKAYLLELILQNENIGTIAKDYILQTINKIENKFLISYGKAERLIPLANHPFEIVMPRLEVLEIYTMLKSTIASIGKGLQSDITSTTRDIEKINEISISRLNEIRKDLFERIKKLTGYLEQKEFLRHLFRQIERVDLLLSTPSEKQNEIKQLQSKFLFNDRIHSKELSDKFILRSEAGALELSPLIGWKAANLAEFETLAGKGIVPPWFAVTDKAFQNVLKTKIMENISVSGDNLVSGITLNEAIDKIVSRTNISNREKSLHIKNLWNIISLPEEIKNEVIKAYKKLEEGYLAEQSSGVESKLYVAIRSSSCEEDVEIAARAGEFETYLFINGEQLLTEYLKQTWSGLWTERAIHNRAIYRNYEFQFKGGVIVQRMVWSRVSGVLQTINVPKKDLREIVINAGLGLGEGVVSGAVAADQIIVSKEGDLEKGLLNFNYVTSDKLQQVVFHKRMGHGTALVPTLYHQRFRPALEYVEMCELVSVATRLESAYGYPLDIEFGIEGTKLWILQVRPVATFFPALKKTLNNEPLFKDSNENRQEKLK
jgi:phosphoenolpyruvate synthase/pyruvate phosphate dikinase